jgi:uncharacterized protein (TIGR02646 family)
MVKLKVASLSGHAERALKVWQSEIDACLSYAERVSRARQRFGTQNRPGNIVFEEVRGVLAEMCGGAGRCMYCDDSAASEVEHFRPKSFYPGLAFVWVNYLYSCGPCNRAKLNHFRILTEEGESMDLMPTIGAVDVPPAMGVAVLLDPRIDDPLEFLSLDLVDTFRFVPRHAVGTWEYSRSIYTIECLKLNTRDILPVARREAYENYRARLEEYAARRGTAEGAKRAAAISRCGHPTVWAEMKAQAHVIRELAELFTAAPEALDL